VDTYVRSGSSANSSFGNASTIEASLSTSSNGTRQAFLRFDLAGTTNTPKSAKLRVYGKLSSSGNITVRAASVANDTWTGQTTWNTKPAIGSTLASASVTSTSNRWIELDVTAAVQAARAAGRTQVSVALVSATNSSSVFQARSVNTSSSGDRPQLVVS
jgi:hypothetical protein